MTRVKIDGDAPVEAGAGHAQILKAGLYEVVYHLVDTGGGLEKFAAFQQLLHGLCVLGKAEEICLLLGVVDLSAAVGALAVDELAFRPEAFAGGAVHTLVCALVDIAVVVHLLEDALYGLDMVVVGGADETVVGDVHELPQVLDAALAGDDIVNELLRRDTGGLGLFLYLLTVLIGAREKHDIVAAQALVSCDGVGCDSAVGVTDMQLIGGVVDRCCDVECSLFHFRSPVLYSQGAAEPEGLADTVGVLVCFGVAEGEGDGHFISSG